MESGLGGSHPGESKARVALYGVFWTLPERKILRLDTFGFWHAMYGHTESQDWSSETNNPRMRASAGVGRELGVLVSQDGIGSQEVVTWSCWSLILVQSP